MYVMYTWGGGGGGGSQTTALYLCVVATRNINIQPVHYKVLYVEMTFTIRANALAWPTFDAYYAKTKEATAATILDLRWYY